MKPAIPAPAKKDGRTRCAWAHDTTDALMQAYHDTEWGVPQHNDAKLFELLILEGAQAGLSWQTILRKRENYRKALDGFDAAKIARYTSRRIETLMQDAGIVRNRAKLEATVANAKAFLVIQKEFGSFDKWIWQFVGSRPRRNNPEKMGQVPALTPQSDAMSKALKERGFKFVGSTICYAFMQATGMVDDHLTTCFRHKKG
jgi:DNA-3-methyladenine glycosylase I